MSDESAELLQLDTEPHVSARSCVELRHARVIAAERQSFPALTFLHAVHVAHVCASHIVCCGATVLTCAVVLTHCSSCNGACTQCGTSNGASVVRMRAIGQRALKRDSMFRGHSVGRGHCAIKMCISKRIKMASIPLSHTTLPYRSQKNQS